MQKLAPPSIPASPKSPKSPKAKEGANVLSAALGGPFKENKPEDGVWRKKMKMKNPNSMNLPLFIDPNIVDKALDSKNEAGRTWRVIRTKKMQEARSKNPENFDQWKRRIDGFYKRAVWGPVPKDTSLPSSAKYKPLTTEANALLPSKTLWHYYYHGGLTRAERRKENLKRIEQMKEDQKKILEKRSQDHKSRLAKFAKRGIQRREKAVHLKKHNNELSDHSKELEHEAEDEAARAIQAHIRGRQTRRKHSANGNLKGARDDSPKQKPVENVAREQSSEGQELLNQNPLGEKNRESESIATSGNKFEETLSEEAKVQDPEAAVEFKEGIILNCGVIRQATAEELVGEHGGLESNHDQNTGPLLSGWSREFSKSKERFYYFHAQLGVSVWKLEDAQYYSQKQVAPALLPPGWIVRNSKTQNRDYFFHVLTGTSVWYLEELPSEPKHSLLSPSPLLETSSSILEVQVDSASILPHTPGRYSRDSFFWSLESGAQFQDKVGFCEGEASTTPRPSSTEEENASRRELNVVENQEPVQTSEEKEEDENKSTREPILNDSKSVDQIEDKNETEPTVIVEEMNTKQSPRSKERNIEPPNEIEETNLITSQEEAPKLESQNVEPVDPK